MKNFFTMIFLVLISYLLEEERKKTSGKRKLCPLYHWQKIKALMQCIDRSVCPLIDRSNLARLTLIIQSIRHFHADDPINSPVLRWWSSQFASLAVMIQSTRQSFYISMQLIFRAAYEIYCFHDSLLSTETGSLFCLGILVCYYCNGKERESSC